jgi:hypothetical protein
VVVASSRGVVLAYADLLHRGDLEGPWVTGVLLSGADLQTDVADRLALAL